MELEVVEINPRRAFAMLLVELFLEWDNLTPEEYCKAIKEYVDDLPDSEYWNEIKVLTKKYCTEYRYW